MVNVLTRKILPRTPEAQLLRGRVQRSGAPALLVADLLLGELLGLDTQRSQLGAGDVLIYLIWDRAEAGLHISSVLRQVLHVQARGSEVDVHAVDRDPVAVLDLDLP